MSPTTTPPPPPLELRERAAKAAQALACSLGFHAKPVGLIDWLRPYNPGEERLHFRSYLGCPRCRREVKAKPQGVSE